MLTIPPDSISVTPSFRQWFVVETLPRKEVVAIQNLERQGYPSFCPRFHKERRHARRVDHLLTPVFPGYAFVSFDPVREPWRAINSSTGVRRLVAAGSSRPLPMPDDAMAQILMRCEHGIMKQVMGEVVSGDVVRFVSGPFADQLATIERLEERGRIRLLLDILGGATSMVVGIETIVPA